MLVEGRKREGIQQEKTVSAIIYDVVLAGEELWLVRRFCLGQRSYSQTEELVLSGFHWNRPFGIGPWGEGDSAAPVLWLHPKWAKAAYFPPALVSVGICSNEAGCHGVRGQEVLVVKGMEVHGVKGKKTVQGDG